MIMLRMVQIIVITVAATVVSAMLYRLGGMAGSNTKVRDFGCPTVALGWMLLCFQPVAWWVHFISFGLMFGALTTYWDDLFGYDNYYMHGGMVALAYLPYAIVTGVWLWFIVRVIVVALFMGIWCDIFKKDWVEEGGRGGIIALSLPLLLL